jgi:hypothetical protein
MEFCGFHTGAVLQKESSIAGYLPVAGRYTGKIPFLKREKHPCIGKRLLASFVDNKKTIPLCLI